MKKWSQKTELPLCRLVCTAYLGLSKFYNWQDRYGRANEHNAPAPRDFWLERWEVEAIIQSQAQYPLEGCRRLCFMMLDRDVVAVSPSSVYRVLRKAGLLGKAFKPSRKGTGFVQPLQPHEHRHVDISYPSSQPSHWCSLNIESKTRLAGARNSSFFTSRASQ
ncbi:MAG: helix-turn-helix domain-containing protein [Verrucomicrobiota bacterium]|jgi:hypothetical protein